MNQLTREQLVDLANGRTVQMPNGYVLRAKQEPDMDNEISDFPDSYGLVAPVEYSKYTSEMVDRPESFNEHAEVLRTYRNDPMWWQPPDDIEHDSFVKNALRSTVTDILNYGFINWVVELCRGFDAYDKYIVRAFMVYGAVEPMLSEEDTVFVLSDITQQLLDEHDLDSTLVLG